MKDVEFDKLWLSLSNLNMMGVFTVVFNASEEAKIRKGFEERYNDVPEQLYLHNVKLVFV
jgi:hypothetical protein